jgi:hypothetical protein
MQRVGRGLSRLLASGRVLVCRKGRVLRIWRLGVGGAEVISNF